jgi:hypothetical protein
VKGKTLNGILILAGLACIGYGLYQIWHPLAWLYAGVVVMFIAREGK